MKCLKLISKHTLIEAELKSIQKKLNNKTNKNKLN